MRNTRAALLCLRHFNPRTIQIEKGVLSQTIRGEPPIFEFDRLASLSNNFRQSFARLLAVSLKSFEYHFFLYFRIISLKLQEIEKCVNITTLDAMLKIVQNQVRCIDEVRIGYGFKALKLFKISTGEMRVDLVYTMHCPMRECRAVFQSIQRLRKHINHDHSNICNIPSDNCATRLCKTSQAILHNAQHEIHSRDVPCCYLCGLANPWQMEHEGLAISHDMIHAMHRFILCKGCMSPMGNDLNGELLLAHFKKCHMVDQPRRFHRCKLCKHNVADANLRDHVMGIHRIIAFRPRYAVESNMLLVTNGSELCGYLGIEGYKRNPLAVENELG
uniref:C2H2-type domain-containing protein n=1 Tax=Heterorhabditis bacteriophora TaxID=37862 RepID=A0A1I7X4U1_HETBA